MNWFYWADERRIGPISGAELKRLAQTGEISPSTKVEDETGKTALAERVSGLFVAPSPFALASKLDGLTEALTAFETRFRELAERLERVETRVADLESRETAPNPALETFEAFAARFEQWDAGLSAVVGKIDALTERASAFERRLDEERRQAKENAAAPPTAGRNGVVKNDEKGGEFELPAGTFYGGTDFPVGRYRVEIKRGGSAVVDLRDGKDGKGSWYLCENNSAIVAEICRSWRFSSTGPTIWKFLSTPIGDEEPEKKTRKAAPEKTTSDYRLSSGKHRVGTDIPSGRYRAEIRRGFASVEVESRDDYEGYVLDADVDSDSYNPSCVLELRSGVKLTLDKPVNFTYLSALR